MFRIALFALFAFAALAHAQTTQTIERLQVTDKIVLKDRYSETTVGLSSPGTRASVENSGVDWNTPNNAGASDNAYTTVSLASGQLSDRLRVSNFGFALPAGAVVLGIEVTIDRKSSVYGRGADSSVRLMKAGSPVGQNKAKTTLYTTTETATVYGSIGDWWETTWTKDEVNNSGFGVEYIAVNNSPAAVLSIDHIRVRVRYKAAAGYTDYALGIKSDGDMAISRGSDPNASESILIDKDTGEVSFPAGVNSTGDIRSSTSVHVDFGGTLGVGNGIIYQDAQAMLIDDEDEIGLAIGGNLVLDVLPEFIAPQVPILLQVQAGHPSISLIPSGYSMAYQKGNYYCIATNVGGTLYYRYFDVTDTSDPLVWHNSTTAP